MELDREAFAEWLLTQGEDVVGRPCDGESCPLASWLSETCGGDWVVCVSFYYRTDGGIWELLPTWARGFVEEVDRRYSWCGVVTGEMALAALVEAVS